MRWLGCGPTSPRPSRLFDEVVSENEDMKPDLALLLHEQRPRTKQANSRVLSSSPIYWEVRTDTMKCRFYGNSGALGENGVDEGHLFVVRTQWVAKEGATATAFDDVKQERDADIVLREGGEAARGGGAGQRIEHSTRRRWSVPARHTSGQRLAPTQLGSLCGNRQHCGTRGEERGAGAARGTPNNSGRMAAQRTRNQSAPGFNRDERYAGLRWPARSKPTLRRPISLRMHRQ